MSAQPPLACSKSKPEGQRQRKLPRVLWHDAPPQIWVFRHSFSSGSQEVEGKKTNKKLYQLKDTNKTRKAGSGG